jgi:hypothetical protein
MLADNRTLFAVWNMGHGGRAGPVARSDDGGLTWTRVDEIMPPNYANFRNCPSIHRLTGPDGRERLWIFAMRTLTDNENFKPIPIEGRQQGWMPRVVSEDDGKTWRELPPLAAQYPELHQRNPYHPDNPFRNVMTFSSLVQLKDGSYLGMFHRATGEGESGSLQVLQSITRDGGFTWSEPVIVCDGKKIEGGKQPCEPYVFRSPDGNELACIMRENARTGTSLVMFSQDEGETWSEAVDTPWGLTLDRHHGIYLPDGDERLVIVGRDTAPLAPAHFIAWVGTYDDLKQGNPGQYRISLLRTFHDGFYPGLHQLPDGTIVATTYTTYTKDDGGCSIVSVRFNIDEIDAMANGKRHTKHPLP